ncbi:MAG TPA: hypothetical protein VL361_12245, partial [Candidatus Limnocylindrales bacterium]|nr:hypothetical protein [Candidatus Limnocylindrales bacterium]
MKQPNERSTAAETLDSSAGTLEVPVKATADCEPPPAPLGTSAAAKATPVQIALVVLGVVAFFYFARPVVLPIFLACVGGMTLKPLIRSLSQCHIPPALSAAVVLLLLVVATTIGFIQIGRPAVTWMNEAPQH